MVAGRAFRERDLDDATDHRRPQKRIAETRSRDQRRHEIAESIREIDSGDGAIILTELLGGTPSNLAISLLVTGRVEVSAGINLPMLIRLAGARKAMNVVDAVQAAQQAGRNYITVASEFLGQDGTASRKTGS